MVKELEEESLPQHKNNSRRQLSVQFPSDESQLIQVHEIIEACDEEGYGDGISDDDSSIWYTKDEFDQMRRKDYKVLASLTSNIVSDDDEENENEDEVIIEEEVGDNDAENQDDLNASEKDEEQLLWCARGLLSSDEARYSIELKREAILAVLTEQERQWDEIDECCDRENDIFALATSNLAIEYDDELIAEAYIEWTIENQEEAEERGWLDYCEIEDYVSEDRIQIEELLIKLQEQEELLQKQRQQQEQHEEQHQKLLQVQQQTKEDDEEEKKEMEVQLQQPQEAEDEEYGDEDESEVLDTVPELKRLRSFPPIRRPTAEDEDDTSTLNVPTVRRGLSSPNIIMTQQQQQQPERPTLQRIPSIKSSRRNLLERVPSIRSSSSSPQQSRPRLERVPSIRSSRRNLLERVPSIRSSRRNLLERVPSTKRFNNRMQSLQPIRHQSLRHLKTKRQASMRNLLSNTSSLTRQASLRHLNKKLGRNNSDHGNDNDDEVDDSEMRQLGRLYSLGGSSVGVGVIDIDDGSDDDDDTTIDNADEKFEQLVSSIKESSLAHFIKNNERSSSRVVRRPGHLARHLSCSRIVQQF